MKQTIAALALTCALSTAYGNVNIGVIGGKGSPLEIEILNITDFQVSNTIPSGEDLYVTFDGLFVDNTVDDVVSSSTGSITLESTQGFEFFETSFFDPQDLNLVFENSSGAASGSSLELSVAALVSNNSLNLDYTSIAASGTVRIQDFNGSPVYSTNTYSLVPEPSAYAALLGLLALGLCSVRRHCRK